MPFDGFGCNGDAVQRTRNYNNRCMCCLRNIRIPKGKAFLMNNAHKLFQIKHYHILDIIYDLIMLKNITHSILLERLIFFIC